MVGDGEVKRYPAGVTAGPMTTPDFDPLADLLAPPSDTYPGDIHRSGAQRLGHCHPTRVAEAKREAGLRVWPNWFEMKQTRASTSAKKLCHTCPLRLHCLEYSVDCGAETVGIFGGVGSNVRRDLVKLHKQAGHWYEPSCGCGYCVEVRGRLSDRPSRLRNRNGEGAQCARISTFGRGCRCFACSIVSGVRTYQRPRNRQKAGV